jgi:hypothetical protein
MAVDTPLEEGCRAAPAPLGKARSRLAVIFSSLGLCHRPALRLDINSTADTARDRAEPAPIATPSVLEMLNCSLVTDRYPAPFLNVLSRGPAPIPVASFAMVVECRSRLFCYCSV